MEINVLDYERIGASHVISGIALTILYTGGHNLKLRVQTLSLWSPGMCISCIFLFSFSLHMCVHMCIYKYYYIFICSIILKYCKYTFWIKYLSIYLFHLRRPVCVALRSVTAERRTICSVGRKHGQLPCNIPPTVSVSIRLFKYPIAGWPISRSAFVARRLFRPLTDWVRIEAIFMCPRARDVPQTRIRLASSILSAPSDMGGFPLM